MTGLTNAMLVIAGAWIIGGAALLAVKIDGAIQKRRGRTGLGPFGVVVLTMIGLAVFAWFVIGGGGGGLEPIRR